MDLIRTRLSVRTLALAAILVLALGLAACGDSDDESNGGAAAAEQDGGSGDSGDGSSGGGDGDGSGTSNASSGLSEEQQVTKMFNDMQNEFLDGNVAGYCDSLTAAGRKEAAKASLPWSKTCEEAIRKSIKANKKADVRQKPSKVLSVKVEGDKATLQIEDAGRKPVPLPAVKQNGEWKLHSIGINYARPE